MFIKSHRLKRPVLSILLAISLALIMIQPAQAQDGIPPRDNIPAGQTIEGDMLLFGQNVTVDGNVTGDLFALGGTVTVNGEIGGSLYAIAETITTNGRIGGSTYQGALELQFGSRAHVGRNAYLIGLDLKTDNGSIVGNDLFAAGLQAWFSGDVVRYLKSVVIVLNLDGKVGIGPEELEVTPEEGSEDSGSADLGGVMALIRLEMPLDEYITSQQPAWFSEWTKMTDSRQAVEQTDPTLEWFLDYFRKLVTVLVFGALAIWLFPAKLKAWSKQVRSAPFSAGLWGLVVLFFAGIVTLVVALLIPAVMVVLWRLTFWGLASVVVSLGYTSLGFGLILFIIAAVYISKVIVAYIIGDLILGRFAPNFATRPFWKLLLGAVIFMALRLIPMVGWIFGLLAALVGLGAIWLVQRRDEEEGSETVIEVTQETEIISSDEDEMEETMEGETDIEPEEDTAEPAEEESPEEASEDPPENEEEDGDIEEKEPNS